MVDINKIRARLAKLKEQNSGAGKDAWRWRPEEGEYQVRLLPWADDPDDPIKTLQFYFGLKKYGLLAPCQFDKPDPVSEFQKALYEDGTVDAKEYAKKLYPKNQGHIPIIVRGEEDKGVRLWRFSPTVQERIYELFLKKGVGVINDPKEGRDLLVKFETKAGKRFRDTSVDVDFEKTPLSDNPKKAKEWLNSIPTLDDKYELLSYDELKKVVDDWFNGADEEGEASGDGTERGGDNKNNEEAKEKAFEEMDEMFEEVMKDD